ncbi:tyrosine-type recombinase/integrase [Fictibacillus enclensis]|uniref:tyrosine-type recombinase/integrase n=1 Tax=Fictibacillus enclensis TaxID=1017270 RepID=UPI0025A150C2|nr:tyrosine-type recombinase/integrase [Fictibacillus enclensis]MDM5335805.1 tyrosine-type recombinase/integrase [Fictibacillus enclensis]
MNLSIYDFKNGNLAIREGKGQAARDIPINKTLSLALDEWLIERNKKKPKTNFLIVSQKGGKLTASGIYSLFENIADQTNIVNITPHTLRHTFAHDLIDKGFPITFVAALLGHNDLDTTRIYIAPKKQNLKEAVESLSDE